MGAEVLGIVGAIALAPGSRTGQAAPMLLHSALLSRLDGIAHGFTTREGPGGVPLDLRLGAPTSAWTPVTAALGLPGAPVARVHQVHGARVLEATEGGLLGEADAIFTRQRGLVLAVRVADCVPVVLVGDGVVAAAHAGWRGLAQEILPATVAAMGGASYAAVGPCIGVRAYEVGPEVVDGIAATGVDPSRFVRHDLGPKPHVDLREAARAQLEAAGIETIEVLPHCTFSDPQLTSYRREGTASLRLAGVVALLPSHGEPS